MKRNFIQVIQKSRVLKSVICLLLCLTLLFNFPFSRPAYATGLEIVLAPVAVDTIGALLVCLGFAVAVDGNYTLTNTYPYIYDYFNNLGSDVYDWIKGIPEDTYYTDGNGKFYVGADADAYELVSPAQMLLKASELPVSWSVPTNFKGVLPNIPTKLYSYSPLTYSSNVNAYIQPAGSLVWFTPWVRASNGTMLVSAYSFRVGSDAKAFYSVNYVTDPTEVSQFSSYEGFNVLGTLPTILGPCSTSGSWITSDYSKENGIITYITTSTGKKYGASINFGNENRFYNAALPYTSSSYTQYDSMSGNIVLPSGSKLVANRCGYLVSTEIPKYALEVDKEKLDGVLVSVGGSPEPPDNNSGDNNDENNQNKYSLLPPELWQVFETVADFLDKTPLTDTNQSTTLGDFVNNNYNYNNVSVDVNVPDRFTIRFDNPLDINLNADVNLGGNININVEINDKTELPSVSEGDGEGFFSANVIDVFSGLTVNNPIMSTLHALFGVIDPALVAIFSVTISLCLLLALWKLIRG